MLNASAPQLLRDILLMMRSRVHCKPLICIEMFCIEMICAKAIKIRRTKRRYRGFYHRAQLRTIHSFATSLTWTDVTCPLETLAFQQQEPLSDCAGFILE